MKKIEVREIRLTDFKGQSEKKIGYTEQLFLGRTDAGKPHWQTLICGSFATKITV